MTDKIHIFSDEEIKEMIESSKNDDVHFIPKHRSTEIEESKDDKMPEKLESDK